MSIVKLSRKHVQAVKSLFDTKKYMGRDMETTDSFKVSDEIADSLNKPAVEVFNNALYNIFCSNYLSDLKNYHAFGYIVDGQVKSMISFYESYEEPSWYYTLYRSSGNNQYLKLVLDEVIKYNESNGRLKFYTLVQERHSKLLRRFTWSDYNNERYGYFDEYKVAPGHKCYYTNAWELLYKRYLLPDTTVVRCNYLKQEYRTELPIGGNM